MSDKLIFYDLKGRKGVAWAPNPWKGRLALNFKGVDYNTIWLEYPELEPTFKAAGVSPNPAGSFSDYSSPTIRLPDGTYVMDSVKIAEKLEADHPKPTFHLENGLHLGAASVTQELLFAIVPAVVDGLLDDWLQEPSKSWFIEDRERRFGMTMQQMRENLGGEKAWQNAEAALKKLQSFLTEHKKDEGPFVLGSTPCYADLCVVALLESLKRVCLEQYEQIIAYDERFKAIHDACKPWTEQDT
ncbi:hypothetical protein BAUCODRAFT_38250 [Baudoinia panamericana UAMH 10762]|uniref:GST N-terminal domain-containing protein n=1 Tax=Baudoinia panamericana (strain UAMH 10762) TaxID=717646 RepID=M2N0S1_BAUPA|nr:uncharacterized protein BAUCODRAFT_38250 [Baudoinia panamericana UAMH 10762]EMC92230.1 hypothetical protein BAUCODRAFT_38250 [Baudoinia panamericana UAMH 10762]